MKYWMNKFSSCQPDWRPLKGQWGLEGGGELSLRGDSMLFELARISQLNCYESLHQCRPWGLRMHRLEAGEFLSSNCAGWYRSFATASHSNPTWNSSLWCCVHVARGKKARCVTEPLMKGFRKFQFYPQMPVLHVNLIHSAKKASSSILNNQGIHSIYCTGYPPVGFCCLWFIIWLCRLCCSSYLNKLGDSKP